YTSENSMELPSGRGERMLLTSQNPVLGKLNPSGSERRLRRPHRSRVSGASQGAAFQRADRSRTGDRIAERHSRAHRGGDAGGSCVLPLVSRAAAATMPDTAVHDGLTHHTVPPGVSEFTT